MPALLFCASWEMGFSGLEKTEALREAPGLCPQHQPYLWEVLRGCLEFCSNAGSSGPCLNPVLGHARRWQGRSSTRVKQGQKALLKMAHVW